MAGFIFPLEQGTNPGGNETMAGVMSPPERGADSGEIIAQRGLECNTAAPSGKSRAPSRNFMRRAALPLYFAGKKWYS